MTNPTNPTETETMTNPILIKALHALAIQSAKEVAESVFRGTGHSDTDPLTVLARELVEVLEVREADLEDVLTDLGMELYAELTGAIDDDHEHGGTGIPEFKDAAALLDAMTIDL